MRKITLKGSGVETSALGFGCASLGTRVSANEALNCLARAWDQGVTYFDVAPSYGRGEAEAILGRFLADRKDKAQVCTKAGLAPPGTSPLMRLALPIIRPIAAAAAPVRRMLRRSKMTRSAALPLTPALLTGSLDRSLSRLGVEQVAVYALHMAAIEDLGRDDILRCLDDMVKSGKTRSISVASTHDAAAAAIGIGAPYGVVQFALDLGESVGSLIRRVEQAGLGCVTDSVLALDGPDDIVVAAAKKPQNAALLHSAGYDGAPSVAVSALLLDRDLALNAQGVVLMSMLSDRHIDRNVARAAAPVRPEAPALVRTLLDAA